MFQKGVWITLINESKRKHCFWVLWIFYGDCDYRSACSCAQGMDIALRKSVKCVAPRSKTLGRLQAISLQKKAKKEISVHSVVQYAYKQLSLQK